VLATMTVPNTGSWQSWQTITANVVLAAGTQTLRIYTNAANGGWNLNWFEILTGNPTNLPPTVNAGIDQTITLPMSSVTLSGAASDPDGTIATYAWTKVSGPAGSTFGTPSSASTTVNGLVQGSYVFRLTVSDNKGATAFDDIVVQVNPAGSTIHVEAENYTAMFGIQTEQTADVGGGLNVGWQDTGDWMDYSVNIPSAGTYPVNFRVASFYTGAQFQLRKSDGAVLATMTVPNTGSWQSWQTITANVVLAAGTQTLRIYTNAANGGWNLNWFEILTGSAVAAASRTSGDVQNINDGTSTINVYPNPVTGNFRLTVNNNQTGELMIQIISANGVVVKTINLQKISAGATNYSLSIPELNRGVYIIHASMDGWNANKQILRQ
jgi:hypothetical protein